jgi:ABC-type multidrug transport system fused ATPase/permease subunit
MIWAIMEKYQHSQMLKKDQRVRLISEILSGIKVLKLYAWELSFIKRINSLRDEEVYQLRLFQFLEGTQYFVWSTAPLLVALASFVTYVLIDPVNNILDSQTAFVSLTLFNTMRGPLFLLPFGIVSLIQGAVSIRRINSFLNSEDLDVKSVSITLNLCI